MDQTCAGEAETTMLAEMHRELIPVTSISTGTSGSAAVSHPAIASCCSGWRARGRGGAAARPGACRAGDASSAAIVTAFKLHHMCRGAAVRADRALAARLRSSPTFAALSEVALRCPLMSVTLSLSVSTTLHDAGARIEAHNAGYPRAGKHWRTPPAQSAPRASQPEWS